jgi:ABC-2 type transport system permease protein
VIVGVLSGVVGREFKRVVRSPARLASTFARPLIWLVIIGSGFSALIPGGQFGYHKYLLAGIMGMVVLFSSLLGALGSIHDREFGSMRMLMIAPVPRGLIVLGKAISSTLLGACFAIVLSPLAWLFQIHVSLLSYLGLIGAVLLTAFALSSLGMLVASRMSRLENFAVVMNFVIFPMFFLSDALYPVDKLPDVLQPFVRANPLTYGVDLMRHAMLGDQLTGVSHVQFTVAADASFLVAFSIVALTLASRLFGSEGHLAPMFLSGVPRIAPAPADRPASVPLGRRAGVGSAPGEPLEVRRAGPARPKVRGVLTSVMEREFKRALRQRGRLASTFARPLLWLIAIGYGFSTLIPGGGYQTYLLPGIVGMAILFSSMLSALGSVHDRQFGPMRMLLIAPVSRGLIVIGKTISSTLLAAFFAIVLSVLAWVFGIDVSFLAYMGFVGAVLLTALAISSLGMLAASCIRQLENFAVAMNFVIFPMFFLSGALYPANTLPSFLQPLVRINPLTYGVDLMRSTLLAGERRTLRPVQFSATTDVAFLVVFSIIALLLAARWFGSEEHLAPMFLSGGSRRVPFLGRPRGSRPPATAPGGSGGQLAAPAGPSADEPGADMGEPSPLNA